MTELLGGLALGVLGSAHCVVMCGPLVVVAGRRRGPGRSCAATAGHLIRYHGARTAVYAMLGAAVGVLGSAVTDAGFGRVLSIGAGAALVAQALAALPAGALSRASGRVASTLTARIVAAGLWLRSRGMHGPLVLGAVNGLLPCGLVYAALTAAFGLGTLTAAVVFMTGFGIGAIPALACVGVASDRLAARLPVRIHRARPLLTAAVGLLLIARGVSVPQPHHHAGAHGHPAHEVVQ